MVTCKWKPGAELDPVVFRDRWKEAGAIGFVRFLVPFLDCKSAFEAGLVLRGCDSIAVLGQVFVAEAKGG
jgi:hypothetical protein